MALDVFMQGYSFVRRNFFWNMGFRLLGSLFLYGRIRKARTRGRKTCGFSGDPIVLTFLLPCFLCQLLLFSVSSTKGCSSTSELEWEWSRILATLCT